MMFSFHYKIDTASGHWAAEACPSRGRRTIFDIPGTETFLLFPRNWGEARPPALDARRLPEPAPLKAFSSLPGGLRSLRRDCLRGCGLSSRVRHCFY